MGCMSVRKLYRPAQITAGIISSVIKREVHHSQRISVIAGKRKDRFRNRISESDYVSEYRCKSDILYRKED